jgi:hypothetical protein
MDNGEVIGETEGLLALNKGFDVFALGGDRFLEKLLDFVALQNLEFAPFQQNTGNLFCFGNFS